MLAFLQADRLHERGHREARRVHLDSGTLSAPMVPEASAVEPPLQAAKAAEESASPAISSPQWSAGRKLPRPHSGALTDSDLTKCLYALAKANRVHGSDRCPRPPGQFEHSARLAIAAMLPATWDPLMKELDTISSRSRSTPNTHKVREHFGQAYVTKGKYDPPRTNYRPSR